MFMLNYYLHRIEVVALVALGIVGVFFLLSAKMSKNDDDKEKKGRKIIIGILMIIVSVASIKLFL